jgi:hypothetical protein
MRIVYAVDIGTYFVGQAGQPLAEGTTAWARLTHGFNQFPAYGNNNGVGTGKDLATLAGLIVNDINAGQQIALGFEAPMWIPLHTQHNRGLQLFEQRFDAEAQNRWYLQAGAAATLKAISIGTLLLSLINNDITTSTFPENNANVILYEAFVAGQYKIPPPQGWQKHPDEWDAMCSALAWGHLHCGFEIPNNCQCNTLHTANSRNEPKLSIWNAIFQDFYNNSDCEVVGITMPDNQ